MNMTNYALTKALVTKIREDRPLVVNITNQVTMDFIANGLLALGASPVMSQAKEEAGALLAIASGLTINLGTLNKEFINLSLAYCDAAVAANVPITLDPVGAGASDLRTKTCLDFLERFPLAIVRGNAGEIMALAGESLLTKGVDTCVSSEKALFSAQALASQYPNTLFVISGETDLLVYGKNTIQCSRGSEWMPRITGSGCLLSSVMTAFGAVHDNPLEAGLAACSFYTISGEIAARKAEGPGTFKSYFLDALSLLPTLNDYE
jgi:hydroxyethylthiazole kinase